MRTLILAVILLAIMSDFLLGEDRFLALCGATKSVELSRRRLGDRMYEQQELYVDSFEGVEMAGKGISRIARYANMHFLNEAIRSKIKGNLSRDDIPNVFQGNKQVYEFVDFAMATIFSEKGKNYLIPSELVVWERCLLSGLNRSGSQLTFKEQSEQMSRFAKVKETLARMTSMEIFLEELNYKRVGEHNKILKDKDSPMEYKTRDKTVSTREFDMVVVGNLKVFFNEDRSFILTEVHYNRALDLFRALRKSVFLKKDLPLLVDAEKVPKILNSIMQYLAKDNCNQVGEVIKAARQISFLSLEESEIIGVSKKMYSAAIDKGRCEKAEIVISMAASLNGSGIILSNILSIYKNVPHPDAPLHKMFESISGVKDPNSCDSNFVSRFEGVLRRSLYGSMKQSGHDVRINSTSTISESLEVAANDVTQKPGAVTRMSSHTWSKTKFQVVRSIISVEDMEVPIASRASSAGILMTTSEEQEARAYFAGYGTSKPMKLMKPTTVNDASTEIKGINKMNIDKAIKRFEKIIDLHEKFESKFPGLEIDDIPSEALERFLVETPMAQYVVNTEGKFGEPHKAVTRLFYMAEQELKALTQRIERLAKQVSRRQQGVSIVKGYLGRRSDLENFVHSMTGDSKGQRSIAVSFDMAEFSKKFPNELVRIFGKILSEITGDSFLERMDLIFRASKVMYSNRGFYNDLRGARGGFEGFLNFVWSSVHACIMEVALETTGVRGELLTFSDDGLLLFYPRSGTTDLEIEDLIGKIRDTYKKLGLIFHLGKTMVSDHMWEYLGDICYNNRLLPSWTKELTKLGKLNPSRGFTPLYDKVKMVNSQSTAFTVASGDPITAFILKRYEVGKMLRSRIGKDDHLLEEVLTVLPTSCGGFRITSPFEDTCYTTIATDSEIFTDLCLLENLEKGLYAKISASILISMSRFQYSLHDCQRAVTSLTIFKTRLPDTSGNTHLRTLLDSVREGSNYTVPKDPLDRRTCQEIYDILATMDELDLSAINLLLNAVPGVSEYQSFSGILKGTGALKLASRKALRRAQKGDTKSVKDAINFWYRTLSECSPATNRNFLESCMELNYPELRVQKFRPSPRLVLKRVMDPSLASIEVTYAGTSSDDIYTASYKEPILKSPSDPTSLSWSSQATGNRTLKDERKFLELLARVISSYPGAEEGLRSISSIFDIIPPKTLSGMRRGAHRTKKNSMKVTDARLILPRYHMYYITSRYLGELQRYLNRNIRADRTTYLVGAESMSYAIHTNYFPIDSTQCNLNSMYYFKIDLDLYNICFPTSLMVDTTETPNCLREGNLARGMKVEYLEADFENARMFETLDMVHLAGQMDDFVNEEQNNLILGGMIKVVENYLVSLYSNTTSTILNESSLPRIAKLRTYIIKRAVVSAAINVMEPIVRTTLSTKVNKYTYNGQKYGLTRSKEFTDFAIKCEYLYTLLPVELTSMTPNIDLEEIVYNIEDFTNILVSTILDMSLLSNNSMVIFFAKEFKASEFSNDHKVAYRKIFRETVRTLFSVYKACRWDEDLIRERYPSPFNMCIDEQIDCLKVLYYIIRSSNHRQSPYNSKSALLEMAKFYELVGSVSRTYKDLDEELTKQELKSILYNDYKNWVPDEDTCNRIRNIVNVLGKDHEANIMRTFKSGVVRRAISNGIDVANSYSRSRTVDARGNVSYEEVRQLQTAFNETLISQARKKVKAYHHSVSKFLGKEFLNITSNFTPIANIESDTDAVVGVNMLDKFMNEDVSELIMNHLDIIRYKEGYLGFKSHKELDGILCEMMVKEYGCEGFVNAPELGFLESDAKFKAFDIHCKNAESALTTYMHLNRDFISSSSIIKEFKTPRELRDLILEVKEDSIMEGDEESLEESIDWTSSNDPSSGESISSSNGSEESDNSSSVSSGKSSSTSMHSLTERSFSDKDKEPSEKQKRAKLTWADWNEEDEEHSGSDMTEKLIPEPASKEDPKENYRVIGVTSRNFPHYEIEANPRVLADTTDVLNEMVDNLSIAESIRETESILSSLTSSSRRSVNYRSSPYVAIRSSHLFTPGRQVNNISTALQAAYDIANEHEDSGMLFSSYVYTISYLRDERTKQGMLNIYREALLAYNLRPLEMSRDIGNVIQWLRSSDLVAGPNIRMGALTKLKRMASKSKRYVKIEIERSPSTMKFRSIMEAFQHSKEAGIVNVGELYGKLFYIEVEANEMDINMMMDILEGFSDEEDEF
jgi:hypothetical protein